MKNKMKFLTYTDTQIDKWGSSEETINKLYGFFKAGKLYRT